MICTKNGVPVWLEEYQAWVQTDRYDVDELLVLRTTARKYEDDGTEPGAHALRIHRIEHWFDEHQDYGVMLVKDGDWSDY